MKMLTFCFVIILLSTFTSVANSKPVINLEKCKILKPSHFAHIFYFNNQGDILFIDFDIIEDEIETVNVIKNGEIVRTEDVSESPHDMIFELDLNKLKKGNYTVELITNTRLTVTKDIAIN